MYLQPNSVFLLDAGALDVDHTRKPVRTLKDSNGKSITSDELLWYISRDPNGVEGFMTTTKIKKEELNRVLLSLTKLHSWHFSRSGKLQVNTENRPYGYGVNDFSLTVPGSLVRDVKKAIQDSFTQPNSAV